MKTIAISIDEETLADLDQLGDTTGRGRFNRSRVVRLALHEYLARTKQSADDAREREILKRHRGRLRYQAAALVKEQAKP
jgi:metal-responsive CopG/Arc/MetJ family transcriptional regulator